ncbi:DUF1737 domain-containing protein [Ahrensia sp. R2A130]|uniref:DUF1737 domain-containing protein n=1 Tax=Ahrensia sp. R2A130 TaxID=744979 RepID=UPI0001E08C48|nr:DUF1737 domain-containing protein [Ahrensia sp. R2A130]EFL89558.1 conserved hypothetical protein [Ahrensia sp. R2A130]
MKLYRLLTGGDDSAFCHKVSLAIAKGWTLHGSPTMTFDTTTGKTVCAQAVVKKVKGKDYSPDMKLGEQ